MLKSVAVDQTLKLHCKYSCKLTTQWISVIFYIWSHSNWKFYTYVDLKIMLHNNLFIETLP